MKAAAATAGIHSMTGFAQARIERDGWSLRINLRSVNHRFLDLHLRMPDGFEVFESRIRLAIRIVCGGATWTSTSTTNRPVLLPWK